MQEGMTQTKPTATKEKVSMVQVKYLQKKSLWSVRTRTCMMRIQLHSEYKEHGMESQDLAAGVGRTLLLISLVLCYPAASSFSCTLASAQQDSHSVSKE